LGLRHDVLRIIYTAAILPILSYGAPVWIECLIRINNTTKLKGVQRLINIKIAKAFRSTSYEALSVLTGIISILIELGNLAKFYISLEVMNKKDYTMGQKTTENVLILSKHLR
jgi:hypothetical protein